MNYMTDILTRKFNLNLLANGVTVKVKEKGSTYNALLVDYTLNELQIAYVARNINPNSTDKNLFYVELKTIHVNSIVDGSIEVEIRG